MVESSGKNISMIESKTMCKAISLTSKLKGKQSAKRYHLLLK